jgi:hypothetical protein
MRKYIKNKTEAYWHWKQKCREYPTGKISDDDDSKSSALETSYRKPPGDKLCLQCAQIEENEKNKIHAKEMIGDDDLV